MAKMISLGKFSIKDMLIDAASEEESHPPSLVVSKKGRNRKSRQAKLKTKVESEEFDIADDNSTKSVGGTGVKSSSRPNE